MNHYKQKILLVSVVFMAITGCNRKSQLLYLSGAGNDMYQKVTPPVYNLKPGDVLGVNIVTQDPEIRNLFNTTPQTTSYATYTSEAAIYATSFSVSDSGNIRLPIIGSVHVSNLSMQQAQDTIQSCADKYLKGSLAIVKLLSFKITVLGEVKRPGTYTNYKDNLNIFEAIGLAGDLTDYGQRSNFLVVRQTAEGTKTFRLDAHDKSIFTSEAFYLLPNDTVIVEPRSGKVMALNTPNISLVLSALTTLMLFLNYLKK